MNRESVRQDKPLVECAMFEMEAHITTFKPGQTGCLQCLYPGKPDYWQRRFPVFGAVSGMVSGYVAFLLMRRMDDYVSEVITTLALVTGGYAIALQLHVSGPIAMVIAGVFIGNTGRRLAMSEETRQHVTQFWHLIDEILNAALFVLIGFQIIILTYQSSVMLISILCVPLAVGARCLAVGVPLQG